MNMFTTKIETQEIKFLHYRKFDGFFPAPRGGITVAYYEKGGEVYFAVARCSELDNFSKHTGRVKSMGRLHSSAYCGVTTASVKAFREGLDRLYAEEFGYQRSYWGRATRGAALGLDKSPAGLYNT